MKEPLNEATVATGVTAARGFRASGVHCGLRRKRVDLALVASDGDASAAAVFTTNRVQAAPVLYSRQALLESGGRARAIVVNSGYANACTGEAGLAVARTMATETAALLEVPARQVLVASTGVIGEPLPIARVSSGLPQAFAALRPSGGTDAAEAIRTTDTCAKQTVRRTASGFVVGGMAKGSGMVHPDLATTLGFVTTDADIAPADLERYLKRAVDRSFHRITVDGDTSTNDMVGALANGYSGVAIGPGSPAESGFETALTEVLVELARAVARDGEGATRLITVEVTGAATEADAVQVARTVAASPLVKTAVHGRDPNWGRVVAAAGRSGVAVDAARLTLRIGGLPVLEPDFASRFDEDEARARMAGDEVVLGLDLGLGPASATTWTCDLTAAYVHLNASYRT